MVREFPRNFSLICTHPFEPNPWFVRRVMPRAAVRIVVPMVPCWSSWNVPSKARLTPVVGDEHGRPIYVMPEYSIEKGEGGPRHTTLSRCTNIKFIYLLRVTNFSKTHTRTHREVLDTSEN